MEPIISTDRLGDQDPDTKKDMGLGESKYCCSAKGT